MNNRTLERRARYRLNLHGCKLHKLRNGKGYVVTDFINGEKYSFLYESIFELMNDVDKLAEKDCLNRST